MLIMKLKYRLADVSKKSNPQFQDKLTEQDFEFMLVKYDNGFGLGEGWEFNHKSLIE